MRQKIKVKLKRNIWYVSNDGAEKSAPHFYDLIIL